jgi:hypothetical protein
MGQDGLRLSRLERYKLASILASSLLQLQTAPWLVDDLEKRKIMFYRQGSKVLIERPYMNFSFKSTKTKTCEDFTAPTAPRSNLIAVKTSLSNLGILLLELCFWQTIESIELRKGYLEPNGQPNQFTNYMAAQEWAQLVDDEGPELAPIIRSCSYSFPVKADWSDKRLVQAAYASIVEPLEKIINKWPT